MIPKPVHLFRVENRRVRELLVALIHVTFRREMLWMASYRYVQYLSNDSFDMLISCFLSEHCSLLKPVGSQLATLAHFVYGRKDKVC